MCFEYKYTFAIDSLLTRSSVFTGCWEEGLDGVDYNSLKMRDAFVPPNPNEFDMTALTLCLRATRGT